MDVNTQKNERKNSSSTVQYTSSTKIPNPISVDKNSFYFMESLILTFIKSEFEETILLSYS